MPTSSRRMRAARAAERLRVETDMFARELKWAVDQIEQDQSIKDYVDAELDGGHLSLRQQLEEVLQEADPNIRYEKYDDDGEVVQRLTTSDIAEHQHSSSNTDSGVGMTGSRARRLIPDDSGEMSGAKAAAAEAAASAAKRDAGSAHSSGSVFRSTVSMSMSREESRGLSKMVARGRRLKSLIQDYLLSSKFNARIQPRGYNKSFGLSAVGVEIISVVASGEGMYIVTWIIPDRQTRQELESISIRSRGGADNHVFNDYLYSQNYSADALDHAVGKALSRNVGKIRYHIGQKVSLKRIPELRFRCYSVEEHTQKESLQKLIDQLPVMDEDDARADGDF